MCRTPVSVGAPTVMDHMLPLELGGRDELHNLWPLCPTCNKAKTKGDIKRIAKMRRQSNMEKPREPSMMRSRGFNKAVRKRMDGTVVPRSARSGHQDSPPPTRADPPE